MSIDLLTIPEKKYVPKSEGKSKNVQTLKNFADNEETSKKVLEWVQKYFNDFKDQSARKEFEEEMDVADELTRAAITATQLDADTDAQHDDTKTNLTTSTFYRYLRAVSAWEAAVIAGNDQVLPVKCEPLIGLKDFSEDEARRQCEYRNLELSYVFDRAHIRSKLSDMIYFGNKYGNAVIEMFWNEQKDDITERVPADSISAKIKEAFTGKRSFKWETKERYTAQWPEPRMRDMRNCWFDATIDDAQRQSCIIFRDQYQLSELYDMQKMGLFKNMEKLKDQHYFNADSGAANNTVLDDRLDNAGEGSENHEITKLFDVYSGWVRVPVNDDGKWDEKSQVARWYWFAFVGDLNSAIGSNILGAAITPNKHKCKKIPVLLYHAKRDDKGAFHVSDCQLAKCHIATEMTIINEAIDNWRQRNRQPLIAERGSLSIRDKTFTEGGNRIWWLKQGAQQPTELKVQDTTGNMLPMLNEVDRRIQDVFGVNKPFLAEALGGRTSASEALFITDQAVKVSLEDAKYKADQLLPFVAQWTMDMMDQFSDPDTTIIITSQDKPVEIKPAEVYGPINVRVTSIKQFQDGILRRREEDDFLSKVYPMMKEIMTPKGKMNMFSQICVNRGFEDVDTWFDTTGKYDATIRARRESNDILWFGGKDMPNEQDDDEAHLTEHKPIHASYTLLPPEQQNESFIQHHAMHIQMHEANLDRKKNQQAMATTQPVPNPVNTPGNEAGGMIAGPMGEMANMMNPEATE